MTSHHSCCREVVVLHADVTDVLQAEVTVVLHADETDVLQIDVTGVLQAE